MMQMLKHCLNPKVIAALVAVGVAIYLVAPGLALAALPLLVLAVCPLSMLLMMGMMGRSMGMGSDHSTTKGQDGGRSGGLAQLSSPARPAGVIPVGMPPSGEVAEPVQPLVTDDAVNEAIAHLERRTPAPPATAPRILYFMTKACSVCETQQDPAFEQLRAEAPEVQVERHDGIQEPALAGKYDVFSYPTTLVFDRHGALVKINRGFVPASALLAQIEGQDSIPNPRSNAESSMSGE